MSLNHKTASFKVTKTADGYPIRKKIYSEKLIEILEKSDKILVINVDHIGSRKLSELRKRYRGRARFLFGKNTLIRRALRTYIRRTGRVEVCNLLDHLYGNCGLVFLQNDLNVYEMMEFASEIVAASRVTCVPRAGDIAPCDVIIRPGETGLEPTRTAFFGAMNIATRIYRGQIQIVNRVVLIRAGGRVDASHAALLNTLGLRPFAYMIKPIALYDGGECYPMGALGACGPRQLAQAFVSGLNNVAALSVALGDPNILTVPHSVLRAYERLVALGVGCCQEYSWPGLDQIKLSTCQGDALITEPADVSPYEDREETPSREDTPPQFIWDSDSDTSSCDSSDDDSD